MKRGLTGILTAAPLAVPVAAQQPAEPLHPPPHYAPWPHLGTGQNEPQVQASFALGPELQRGWESGHGLEPSQPQMAIATGALHWLPVHEARLPKGATAPFDAPAVSAFQAAASR